MRSAGLDLGSRTIKLVVVEGGAVVRREVHDTGSSPLEVCRALLDGERRDALAATGYGRHLVREHWPEARVLTEISAVALGARSGVPTCRAVIDLGGGALSYGSITPALGAGGTVVP